MKAKQWACPLRLRVKEVVQPQRVASARLPHGAIDPRLDEAILERGEDLVTQAVELRIRLAERVEERDRSAFAVFGGEFPRTRVLVRGNGARIRHVQPPLQPDVHQRTQDLATVIRAPDRVLVPDVRIRGARQDVVDQVGKRVAREHLDRHGPFRRFLPPDVTGSTGTQPLAALVARRRLRTPRSRPRFRPRLRASFRFDRIFQHLPHRPSILPLGPRSAAQR
jgi:hypothetical protein